MAEQLEEHIVPEDLNFSQKLRALGSKSAAHVEQTAVQTANVNAGTGLYEFIIPGQQRAKFMELKNAFVAVNIANSDASALATAQLQGCGTMGLVARRRITTSSGAIICDTANVNCLDAAILNKHATNDWLESTGNALFLTNTNALGAVGDAITTGSTRRVLIPIHLVGIDEVLFPLVGVENIHIEITFESAATGFIASTTGLLDSEITYSNAILHYETITLENNEYQDLLESIGGKFNLTVPCWDRAGKVILADETSSTLQIATSRKKAKRVLIVQRLSTLANNDVVNSFSMDRGGVSYFSLLHNGVEVKNRDYRAGLNDGPEALAFALGSDGGNIMDTSSGSQSTNARSTLTQAQATGVNDTASGRYFMEFDLQSGFQVDGATVSGINAIAGSLIVSLTRGTTAADRNLDVFTEYWADLELDMTNTQSWVVKT